MRDPHKVLVPVRSHCPRILVQRSSAPDTWAVLGKFCFPAKTLRGSRSHHFCNTLWNGSPPTASPHRRRQRRLAAVVRDQPQPAWIRGEAGGQRRGGSESCRGREAG